MYSTEFMRRQFRPLFSPSEIEIQNDAPPISPGFTGRSVSVGTTLYFQCPLVHHGFPLATKVLVGPNHRIEKIPFPFHQETNRSYPIQTLPPKNAASNAAPMIVLQQEKQVVSEIELCLSGTGLG